MTDDELRHVFEVAEDHALQSGATLSEAAMIAARVVERAARAAEREACARVCEETTAAWTQPVYNSACMDCATAIRAEGKR